jgi:YD repeat-containing protein
MNAITLKKPSHWIGRRLLFVAFALFGTLALATRPGSAPAAVGTPQHPNRTLPNFIPRSPADDFSVNPTEDTISRSGLFHEPLIPIGATTSRENADLAKALVLYREAQRARASDAPAEPLQHFLSTHPNSPWGPSLQVNLGTVYRLTGQLSRALTTWQSAWAASKDLTDPRTRPIGDISAAYLSQFYAYLGRKDDLSSLLAEVQTRPMGGSAAELLSESARGLADMRRRPEVSFKCGPLALAKILRREGNAPDLAGKLDIIDRSASTPDGLSLVAVRDLSAQVGMKYQMAFRSPGAPLPTPAVVHWRLNHYAAILGVDSAGRYVVGDATFGETVRVSRATMNEEASGYFLLPPGPLPEGWRSVDAAEGQTVWGRGNTGNNKDNDATGPDETKAFPCRVLPGKGKDEGCTAWNVEAMVVGLQLHDNPMGYTPPVGPRVDFPLYYSHRDAHQPSTGFDYVNFGPLWTSGWFSYVTPILFGACPGDSVTYVTTGTIVTPVVNDPNTCFTLYGRGGGYEQFTFPNNTSSGGDTTPQPVSLPGAFSQSTLNIRFGANQSIAGFTRLLPDGSQEQFDNLQGGTYYMTYVQDPQGNGVTITYDNRIRIVALTDALGLVTTFSYPSSTAWNVTQVTDPFGRQAEFGYDPTGRLTSITDVLGITSIYAYNDPFNTTFVSSLTTPYGTTNFMYGDEGNLSQPAPAPQETTRFIVITDPMGRVSRVEFNQGASSQSAGGTGSQGNCGAAAGTIVPCTEPAWDVPTGFGPRNINLEFRNTFVWTPVELEQATANTSSPPICSPLAFTLALTSQSAVQQCAPPATPLATWYSYAHVLHWLHTEDGISTSRVLESEKEPFQTRIWYDYGTSSQFYAAYENSPIFLANTFNKPTTIARVICDTAPNQNPPTCQGSQIWTYSYHPTSGNVLQTTDPVGRQFTYTYADATGIDLATVTNTSTSTNTSPAHNDLLLTLSNYFDHLPQTIIGANGQSTTKQYNSIGQLLTSTDALGNAWTYAYNNFGLSASLPDDEGFLYTIQGPPAPPSATVSSPLLTPTYTFGYDSYGRVSQVTDTANVSTYFDYDAANRLTNTHFADGTTQSVWYDLLDLYMVQDRRGGLSTFAHNPDRELWIATDPDGRSVVIADDDDGAMKSVQANGQTTNYVRDLQGKPTAIKYPDGTSQTFAYDTSERLVSVINVNSANPFLYVQKIATYNVDDTLATTESGDSTNGNVGPWANFFYDSAYVRLSSYQDATGTTTTYNYNPVTSPALYGAGLLHSIVNSNGGDTVSYYYDSLNRVEEEEITANTQYAGSANPGYTSPTYFNAFQYDAAGRLQLNRNSLDYDFAYSYSDPTTAARRRHVTEWPASRPDILWWYGG